MSVYSEQPSLYVSVAPPSRSVHTGAALYHGHESTMRNAMFVEGSECCTRDRSAATLTATCELLA